MARILVVDDELSLVLLLQNIIEDLGHEVLTASNGQEALQIVEREHPRLVISDVMMPLMDGYKLLEQIRLRPELKAIKVILVSAAPIAKKGEFSADEYRSKPFDIDEIEELVDQLTD